MTSQVKISEKKRGRAAWPVIGFILALALGVIGFILADTILSFLGSLSPGLRGALRTLPLIQRQLIVALVFFLLSGALASLIVAVFAPKQKSVVSYKDVAKERETMVLSKKRDKVRQRMVNQQYREQQQKKTK